MSIIQLIRPIGAFVSLVRYKLDRLRLNKLIRQGLKVGKNVYIMEDVEFDLNYPFLIEIGDNCNIAKGVRILAHDASIFRGLGVTRIAPVKILEGTFIAERVTILPGVTIGPRALIAAGSVVNRDIGEDRVAAGNPARPYGKYSDMLVKYADTVRSAKVFKKEEIENGSVTTYELISSVKENQIAFIRGVPSKDPYYVNANYAELRKNAREAYRKLTSLHL